MKKLLGDNDHNAWKLVNKSRRKMKKLWIDKFKTMVEAEKTTYGTNSYFKSIEGMNSLVALRKITSR